MDPRIGNEFAVKNTHPIVLVALLSLVIASSAMAAAKPGLDRAPSLLTRLQQGIEEHNDALETLLRHLEKRRDPKGHHPDVALLERLKNTPGVRPELLAMIERYQTAGNLDEGRASTVTVANLFDELKGQLAKEHRERLTQIALERVTREREIARQRQATRSDGEPLLPLAL